jgi:uncharacterized protein YgiM (DUF1202 family)
VLDEDGTFCITLTGIKALAGAGDGDWATLGFVFGGRQVVYTDVVYSNVARSSANPDVVTTTPTADAVVSIKTGSSVSLVYKIGGVTIPPSDITWSVFSNSTASVSLSGNTVTGLSAGTAYLMAKYKTTTTIVRVDVTGPTVTVDTSATVYSVTANTLNVRSGPGTGYGILGTLPRGALVNGYGKTGSWMKITYNGSTAYVSANYLAKVN